MISQSLSIGDRLADKIKQKAATMNIGGELAMMEWVRVYLPHYFYRSMSLLHKELAETGDSLRLKRGQKKNIIAPRGNAKSTWLTLAIPLKAVCEGTEKYILLIGESGDLAEKYLASIKDELLTNDALRERYPTACKEGTVWNSSRIELDNDCCIEAIGKGAGARGRKYKQYRPTLIIMDDPQCDEDCLSPITRTKDYDWFNKTLLPVGDTDTNFLTVGTMLHRECIVGQIEKRGDFITIKFAAIMSWPTRMDLWDGWEAQYYADASSGKINARRFYSENKADMDSGSQLLWEEKEDLYELMQMRANNTHAAFESEKQNNPRDPTKCEFEDAWFSTEREEVWYKTRPVSDKYIIVSYCDPSKGVENKRGDDSALITLFYDPAIKKCYVEFDLEKRPVNILVDALVKTRKLYRPEIVGFEINGFQELMVQDIMDKDPLCPIYTIENRVNKMTRISRLGIFLQRGFFLFKIGCRHTNKALDQLRDHPHATHDDGADGLEGCLRTLDSIISINVETEEEEVDYAGDGLGDGLFSIDGA